MSVYPFDPPPTLLDFLVLLALKDEPLSGYQVDARVITSTHGRIHYSTGAVYKALPRLCNETDIHRLEEKGPKGQIYYSLTEDGRRRLGREISVLRDIVRLFDQRAAI